MNVRKIIILMVFSAIASYNGSLVKAAPKKRPVPQEVLPENVVNEHGETALHVAARDRDLANVQKLVEQNPELMCMVDHEGNTPLHTAAQVGSERTFRNGAWITISNAPIVQYLIAQHPESIYASNNAGNTPFLLSHDSDIQELFLNQDPALSQRRSALGKRRLRTDVERHARSPVKTQLKRGAPLITTSPTSSSTLSPQTPSPLRAAQQARMRSLDLTRKHKRTQDIHEAILVHAHGITQEHPDYTHVAKTAAAIIDRLSNKPGKPTLSEHEFKHLVHTLFSGQDPEIGTIPAHLGIPIINIILANEDLFRFDETFNNMKRLDFLQAIADIDVYRHAQEHIFHYNDLWKNAVEQRNIHVANERAHEIARTLKENHLIINDQTVQALLSGKITQAILENKVMEQAHQLFDPLQRDVPFELAPQILELIMTDNKLFERDANIFNNAFREAFLKGIAQIPSYRNDERIATILHNEHDNLPLEDLWDNARASTQAPQEPWTSKLSRRLFKR